MVLWPHLRVAAFEILVIVFCMRQMPLISSFSKCIGDQFSCAWRIADKTEDKGILVALICGWESFS
jgi:hypothetical protein